MISVFAKMGLSSSQKLLGSIKRVGKNPTVNRAALFITEHMSQPIAEMRLTRAHAMGVPHMMKGVVAWHTMQLAHKGLVKFKAYGKVQDGINRAIVNLQGRAYSSFAQGVSKSKGVIKSSRPYQDASKVGSLIKGAANYNVADDLAVPSVVLPREIFASIWGPNSGAVSGNIHHVHGYMSKLAKKHPELSSVVDEFEKLKGSKWDNFIASYKTTEEMGSSITSRNLFRHEAAHLYDSELGVKALKTVSDDEFVEFAKFIFRHPVYSKKIPGRAKTLGISQVESAYQIARLEMVGYAHGQLGAYSLAVGMPNLKAITAMAKAGDELNINKMRKAANALVDNRAPRLNRAAIEIEGMPHGGLAEKLRKAMTDFGSPWRGIFAASDATMSFFHGNNRANTITNINKVIKQSRKKLVEVKSMWAAIGKMEGGEELLGVIPTVAEAEAHVLNLRLARLSGHKNPVIVNTDKVKTRIGLEGSIVHEKTHVSRARAGWMGRPGMIEGIDATDYFGISRFLHEGGYNVGREVIVREETIAFGKQVKHLMKRRGMSADQVAAHFSTAKRQVTAKQVMALSNAASNYSVPNVPSINPRGLKRLRAFMQAATDMVKTNKSNFTTPGLARLANAGGSRRMPRGGS